MRQQAGNSGPQPTRATGMGVAQAYAVLGVASSASDAEVKKAYRRLMSENHPDKLVARGLPVGTFRVVAAGKGGHVLVCDPSFVTIRVSSNSAVEIPPLHVLRAR